METTRAMQASRGRPRALHPTIAPPLLARTSPRVDLGSWNLGFRSMRIRSNGWATVQWRFLASLRAVSRSSRRWRAERNNEKERFVQSLHTEGVKLAKSVRRVRADTYAHRGSVAAAGGPSADNGAGLRRLQLQACALVLPCQRSPSLPCPCLQPALPTLSPSYPPTSSSCPCAARRRDASGALASHAPRSPTLRACPPPSSVTTANVSTQRTWSSRGETRN